MGNDRFVNKYQIKTDAGIPKSTAIERQVHAYSDEFHVKAQDRDHQHVQSYSPNSAVVSRSIEFFNSIQTDMLNEIFEKLDTLELSEQAYNKYYLDLKDMVSDEKADVNQPEYYVYHETAQSLTQHLRWLEGYITKELIPAKTITNDQIRSVNLHREKRDSLSLSCNAMFEETKQKIDNHISNGVDHSDLIAIANMRLENAKIHLKLSTILDKLSKNLTLTEEEYNYVKRHMIVDQVPQEREDNEKIIAIAESMITIAPGFPAMAELIAAALKNHVDELLTVFMSAITARIKTVSDNINSHNLNITKMVLILNVYLKIFRDIVPKLSLASSYGNIRYCSKDYNVEEVFSNKKLDDSYPAELQHIHDEYARALRNLKEATERFILKLVAEINTMIVAYENEPSQNLAQQIMERIVGHKQCLNNYRLLFKDATDEGLSNFELDKTLIPSSQALLKALINKIKDQAMPLITDYRVLHKMDALTRQIERFGYLEAAHNQYYYDDSINQSFQTAHKEIEDMSAHLNQRTLDQLALVKHHLFNITLRNILFFNDTFNELLHTRMNIPKPSSAQLIKSAIILILNNPQFKISRVVFDDIARVVDERVPVAEQEALKHMLPCPDFDWQVADEPSKAHEYAAIILNNHYDFALTTSPTQVNRLAHLCSKNPSELTIEQYEALILTIIQANTKLNNDTLKQSVQSLLISYINAYDRLNQYTNISYLHKFYETLNRCLVSDELRTLSVLAESTQFIKQCPLDRMISLLEAYKIQDVTVDINAVKHIHGMLVNHVLTSPKIPSNINQFMNHMLILMNNPSLHTDDPLNTKANNITDTKLKELSMFIDYTCHYIKEFQTAHDFVEKLSQYIDHIVSYGISLTPDDSSKLLSSMLALGPVPFKRVQNISVRLIHLLPDISAKSPMSHQIHVFFALAVQNKTNLVADAILDSNNTNVFISEEALNTYQPESQSALSPGANAIHAHFNRKVRHINEPQTSDAIIERLNKQMRKLDTIMVMLGKVLVLEDPAAIKTVFNHATDEISHIENRVSHFFGTQRNLASSLCSGITKLSSEELNKDNIVLLRSQLLVQYDRLMAMMVDRLIEDLELNLYSKDEQRAYLTIVHKFMDTRHHHLCKTHEYAANLISSAIADARKISGRWKTSPCEIFLKNMTLTAVMHKNEYTSLMTAISDQVVELGGAALKSSTDPVAPPTVVPLETDNFRDFVL